MERNLDFDKVINRKNTNSIKYDSAEKLGKPDDILPLWVADMDFQVSSYIQDAIKKQAEHGIYGYSEPDQAYFQALQSWMAHHFDWCIEEEWLVCTPGVVFALAQLVQALTKEGDAVIIQQPVYHPFKRVIGENNRRVVDNTLVQAEDGTYHMDLRDFEEKVIKEDVKLFILCNPHNPVGRAWDKEELEALGDICCRHHVIVVSDEIHADFVYQKKHVVFANIKESFKEITITCTAPSKTFNIAGLQISNILIANAELRKKLLQQLSASGAGLVNSAGIKACQAAYENGEVWYQNMLTYIKANIEYLKNYLEKNIPEIRMVIPEATYLVWLDFRALHLSAAELDNFIVNKAKLWFDGGEIFGATGQGFQRINVACPLIVLKEALQRLEKALSCK